MDAFIDNATLKAWIEADIVDLDAIIDTHMLVLAGKPAVCRRYTDLGAEYTQTVTHHILLRRYRTSHGYSGNELARGVDEAESMEQEWLLAHAVSVGRVLGIPADTTLAACYRD